MLKSRFASTAALALAGALFLLPGCGQPDGEMASPVNKEEAASQSRAYADFAKTKKAGKPVRDISAQSKPAEAKPAEPATP